MAIKKPTPKQTVRGNNGKKREEPALQGEVLTGNEVVPMSEREAPVERVLNKNEIVQSVFNDAQLAILLNRTPKWAIKVRQGRGGNYRYVPHGYVTDTLNKAFGFNWDLIVDDIEPGKKFTLMIEDKYDAKGNPAGTDRHIAIEGHITMRIMDWETGTVLYEIVKHGFGSSLWLPGQELGDALKSARSDLVKTCAYQVGIALDLYWNEKAEFENWDKAETRKEEQRKAREIIAQMQSDVPTIPVMLLSKAKAEYDLDGEQVAKILELEDPDDIVLLSSEVVPQKWQIIVDYMEEQEALTMAKEAARNKKKK